MRITAETPIVLGSASPRRRELLSLAEVPFVVRPADADESAREGEVAGAYLERIARAKLEAVRFVVAAAGDIAGGGAAGDIAGGGAAGDVAGGGAAGRERGGASGPGGGQGAWGATGTKMTGATAILVADTIVVAPDGSVLGKPRGDDDGRGMLERLAGTTHTVRTRFLLATGERGVAPLHGETVVTQVTFRPLSAGEIARYVASGEGRDKAGGYAVQGGAGTFATRIDGSYTNVVGLPLCEVVVALRGLGWLSAP